MRSFTATILLAATVSVSASALFRRQYPSCANTCLMNADFGDCGTDSLCLCKDENFIKSNTECFAAACEGDELEEANAVARDICTSVGVNLEDNNSTEGDGSTEGDDSSDPPTENDSTEDGDDTPEGAALATGANALVALAAVGFVSFVL